ncbi:hypothetical protein [Streptomyces sp. NPDC055992]|uniref:hypothetical protein n=1 Tax=Streptomyces sp. NPDC055992 TaxID=3345673 RepID=UPI0035D5474B
MSELDGVSDAPPPPPEVGDGYQEGDEPEEPEGPEAPLPAETDQWQEGDALEPTAPDDQTETDGEPPPQDRSELNPEPEPEPEPDAEPEPPELEPESEPESEPDSQPEPEPEPEADAEPEPEDEADAPRTEGGAGAVVGAAQALVEVGVAVAGAAADLVDQAANALDTASEREPLHAFGNKEAPKPVRLDRDLHVESPDEVVGPFAPQSPTDDTPGKSTFVYPEVAPVSGQFHVLAPDAELPPGLGIHADGEDVGGMKEWGHRTIYPTVAMSAGEFSNLVAGLDWVWVGNKKK